MKVSIATEVPRKRARTVYGEIYNQLEDTPKGECLQADFETRDEATKCYSSMMGAMRYGKRPIADVMLRGTTVYVERA